MLCINCDQEATWVFRTPGVSARNYCNIHLPGAYRGTREVAPLPKDAPAKPRARRRSKDKASE